MIAHSLLIRIEKLELLLVMQNHFKVLFIIIIDENCLCKLDRYSVYLDPFYDHILTGNLNIIADDNLRNFMNLDFKHRLDFNYNRSEILKFFDKDTDIFILKLVYKYVWPIEDFFK